MRITLEVKNSSITENGMMLLDKEGNIYHWITKHYSHPLFFTNEWVRVKMTILDNAWGHGKIAKNVRLIKKPTNSLTKSCG